MREGSESHAVEPPRLALAVTGGDFYAYARNAEGMRVQAQPMGDILS